MNFDPRVVRQVEELELAHHESQLPEVASDAEALDDLLVRVRMKDWTNG